MLVRIAGRVLQLRHLRAEPGTGRLQRADDVVLITGGLGNRDEYNLSIYLYDKAFTMPPSYGLGAALALILTVILLVITVGYVRASVRQGAIA